MKKEMFNSYLSVRSQVTVFVVIALVVVGIIAGFFIVRSGVFQSIPSSVSPVYDYYISCVGNIIKDGANIAGSQAGYIYTPEFSAGNKYAPFSSQLSFMGLGLPYWYYLSGNNVVKEQIPTKSQIAQDIEKYVFEQIERCNIESFQAQGYNISVGDLSSVNVEIKENNIAFSLNQRLVMEKGDDKYSITSHRAEIDSSIGRLYDLAKKLYQYEQKTLFLENYSRDVLYTYAPVSGVELSCSPVTWNPYEVIATLKKALGANLGSIKLKGDYYTLNKETNNYFVLDADIGLKNERFNFLYSSNWSSRFEIWPTKNNLMIASPVGTQQGLGSLGFCYAPYKFVYDMYFPVLIQVYDESASEIFQFPMAIVINKNNPREAIEAEYTEEPVDVCDYMTEDVTINTYNNNLEPVEADITFRCLTSSCGIGKTKLDNASGVASLNTKVPSCLNGVVIASSKGYKEQKYFISTNEENSADIILEKEFKLGLEVYVDGVLANENSVIVMNEISEDSTNFVQSITYPLKREISIGEGNYEFDLKVYKNGNIIIPGTTTQQCVKQAKFGLIGAVFGFEEDKCFEVEVPSQTLSNLVYAGGMKNHYLAESELAEGNILRIYTESVQLPSNLEEIEASLDNVEKGDLVIDII